MARSEYSYGSTARSRKAERPALKELQRRQNAVHLHIGNILFGLAAAAIMVYVAFAHVALQSEVTRERREYASLTASYEELHRMNDLYYERIISSVDMDEIARIAREELGMRIAGDGQIVSYAGQIDDYVKQYSDIPSE